MTEIAARSENIFSLFSSKLNHFAIFGMNCATLREEHEQENSVKNAYIKFSTMEDHAVGFHALVARFSVSRLSNDIYCIPWPSLAVLEDGQIGYQFATEDDLSDAKPLWNFAVEG